MSHNPAIMATLQLLAERWPRCFVIFEQHRKPLKIGIHLDILAALDGAVTPAKLSRALRAYASNSAYRGRLVAGAVRVDLDGEPAGIVTPEQVPEKIDRKAPQPISKKPDTTRPPRLGFADLKQAALQRKAAAS